MTFEQWRDEFWKAHERALGIHGAEVTPEQRQFIRWVVDVNELSGGDVLVSVRELLDLPRTAGRKLAHYWERFPGDSDPALAATRNAARLRALGGSSA